jgi:uncharacterized protein (TIGR02246 family)
MSAAPRPSARRSAVFLLAAFAAAAAACGGGSDGVAEVKTLVGRQVEAINARDMQGLARIWSQDEDILLFDVAPPGRFEGWPAIARSFNDLFEKTSEIKMTVENLKVRPGRTLAVATYDWTMTGTMGEAALEDRGQATEVYRREKDGWRLVSAHYSAAPRAPETAAAPEKPSKKPSGGKPSGGKAAGAGTRSKPAGSK